MILYQYHGVWKLQEESQQDDTCETEFLVIHKWSDDFQIFT